MLLDTWINSILQFGILLQVESDLESKQLKKQMILGNQHINKNYNWCLHTKVHHLKCSSMIFNIITFMKPSSL